MNNKPFIHTFKTSNNYYVYDVNTDKILKIPQSIYDILNDKDNEFELSNNEYIINLKNKGYLKSTKVEETEHPETKYLRYTLENKLDTILLQVTQNCNLKCEYCIYSGGYKNRNHSDKRMSIETAKKGIDFLINNSKDSEELHIGFYGGEPLLEMGLIKECILYALEKGEGREIFFNLTTNGTLLKSDIISFFEKYGVSIMVSLDGPAEIHDKNRKFANGDIGTHEFVIKNLEKIKKEHPIFFKDRVLFNTVLDVENEFSCVENYVSGEDLFNDSIFLYSLINDNYALRKRNILDKFIIDENYEMFKIYLNKLGKINDDNVSKILKVEVENIGRSRIGKHVDGRQELPKKWHHGGPCVPGALRTFLTVDGDLYPCERVSETSKVSLIGNIESGFDYERIEEILNIEKVTEDQCHNCWVYSYCSTCIACADDLTTVSKDLILKQCKRVRNNTEEIFKDYCVLKELGYDFETDNLKNLI